MTKRIIQVPMDKEMLEDLDNLSEKQHKARAEVIRQACRSYLEKINEDELDRIYAEGYRRIPEEGDIGEAQLAMLSEILTEESW